MHLDFGNTPDDLDAHLVCELTEQYKLGGRVAIGHATKLSTLDPAGQQRIARRLADAGVAVTILPATDLFLMGRDQQHNVRRGLVDANLFVEHGCNCSISTNNILNPFTPYGDCSLIRMANLHANVLQVSHDERIAECFAMLTTRSARLMNLKDYGIAVGQSGRRRGDRRAEPEAGGRRDPPAARRVQARQAHRDAPPRRTAPSLLKPTSTPWLPEHFASRWTASPDASAPTST